MSIREWIRNREIRGVVTFSFDEVHSNFNHLSIQNIYNDLSRLVSQRIIANVYRGFYVVIPPHYAQTGAIPEVYYIDYLMRSLNKSYYVALLNAAQFYGAAHQKPQTFSVATTKPKLNKGGEDNTLKFFFKNLIPNKLLRSKNTETGEIWFSSPELTAVDLVQYYKRVGGLSRAATVIAELGSSLDFNSVNREIFQYAPKSALQRLGYILEYVTEMQEQADILFERLIAEKQKLSLSPLTTSTALENKKCDNRWRVIVNSQIEIDEL